jgi:hypothetical protein
MAIFDSGQELLWYNINIIIGQEVVKYGEDYQD